MPDYDDFETQNLPEVGFQPHVPLSFQPLKTIWFHPRATVRKIVEWNPRYKVFLLTGLAGITDSLSKTSSQNGGRNLGLTTILAIALLAGPLGGWIKLWIGSHLVKFTGRKMGGKASLEQVRTAIAWSNIPAIAGLSLWFLGIVLFREGFFTTETPKVEAYLGFHILSTVLELGIFVLAIWGIILLCHSLAEVQGFRSAWKGFANLILSFLAILVPIALVVFLLVLLR